MKENKHITGFTFVELLVVLAILSVMVTIALPYASHSNQQLQLHQETASLKTAITLLIEQAKKSQSPTRLIIDPAQRSYQLQQATNRSNEIFEPLPGSVGQTHYLQQHDSFDELKGFQTDGQSRVLLFDPSRLWPQARLTIINEQATYHLLINGQQIEYKYEN